MPAQDPFADPTPLIQRVYAYVAYRVGSGPEAEDITSDAFERALRYRDSFDARKGDAVSWLIGIARRCVADSAMRGVPTAELVDVVDPSELEASTAQRVDIAAAVTRLDERDRELIALRYGADLTAKQIAEVVGMRTNAVEVALHRALRSLREVLEDGDEEEPATRRGGLSWASPPSS
jgi:RNA polymerase sigma factor (sigma-70 family)